MKQNSDTKPLILLIFADDDEKHLPSIRKERQFLRSLLEPRVDGLKLSLKELGYSTAKDVIEALNIQRERLSILHFAGHSGTDLLQLDEGTIHAKGIAKKLADCPNLRLVFLNGCNNSVLVSEIVDAGIPNVIGTCNPVADEAAYYFSEGFYLALVEQKITIEKSFRQAISNVESEYKGSFRSLDLRESLDTQLDWTWITESSEPEWRFENIAKPCNRLPPLIEKELPPSPFKRLNYFTEEDAEIFFGRCDDTLNVLSYLDNFQEPVLIIDGATGVGKSSFLQAGLMPRLKSPTRKQLVRYWRYEDGGFDKNLLGNLLNSEDVLCYSENCDLPLLLIFDQVERLFIAESMIDKKSRLSIFHNFLSYLHVLFYTNDGFLKNNFKVIFSIRKEWLSDLVSSLGKADLNFNKYLIEPLGKNSITEVIESPTENERLFSKYRMSIKNESPSISGQISNDLLEDKESNIAPALQILLSNLWDDLQGVNLKILSNDLYLQRKKKGILLEDYLDNQIEDIVNNESWGSKAWNSGLILDILNRYSSSEGVFNSIENERYFSLYQHASFHKAILASLKERYILLESSSSGNINIKKSRLAHDTLSELVKIKYESSDFPGQRMNRILNIRYPEWVNSDCKKSFLDTDELAVCDEGRNGRSVLSDVEEKYIEQSKRKNFINVFFQELVVFVIFFSSFFIALLFLSGNGMTIPGVKW